MTDFKLTSDKSTAVSRTTYWDHDMSACPRGVKMLLLGKGGVATIGHYDGKDKFFVAWCPLPKIRKDVNID